MGMPGPSSRSQALILWLCPSVHCLRGSSAGDRMVEAELPTHPSIYPSLLPVWSLYSAPQGVPGSVLGDVPACVLLHLFLCPGVSVLRTHLCLLSLSVQ